MTTTNTFHRTLLDIIDKDLKQISEEELKVIRETQNDYAQAMFGKNLNELDGQQFWQVINRYVNTAR